MINKRKTLQSPNEEKMGDTKIINFSGYEWQVKGNVTVGPGPNNWSSDNVWIDEDGLHLKITQQDGKWYCAEIYTTMNLGFGKYQFDVIGRIDQFDPNIVLGLFNFPEFVAPGEEETNEIDIEIARWSSSENPNGNFLVWPSVPGLKRAWHKFSFSLNGNYTTHRFDWTSKKVEFQSLHGHTNNNEHQIAAWSYQPDDSLERIPQQPLRLHMNLWLFQGQPPTDLQEVEVIISNFQFIPAS